MKPTRAKLLRSYLLFSTLFVFLATPVCWGTRKEQRIDSWKPVNYEVNLTFDDGLTQITSASTKITLTVLKDHLSAIDLDFGMMTIDSVTIRNRNAKFDHRGETLRIWLPEPAGNGKKVELFVRYHGKPKDGLVIAKDKDGQPAVVGDNWPNRVHHWIPCLDHPSAKATISFNVTAPAKNLVMANGQLDHVKSSGQAMRTWSYTEKVPIPPYCMIVAVGDFAKSEPTSPAVTSLSYYVPRSDRSFAIQGFVSASPSLKFFSQTVAPYPYEKLDLIVGATQFGGMENSSAIVFTSNLFGAGGNPKVSPVYNIRSRIVELVAHEIAHQWFGDSVTESTWADLWLSEGFATYFAGLFLEKHEGHEAFQDFMKRAAESYLRYALTTRTPIFDVETEDLLKLLNENNYQKGAWVSTLR